MHRDMADIEVTWHPSFWTIIFTLGLKVFLKEPLKITMLYKF